MGTRNPKVVTAMYHFTYKCRLCGATYVSAGCSDRTQTAKAMIGAAQGYPDKSHTRLHEVHCCKTIQGYGIADLIGAKFTPDK